MLFCNFIIKQGVQFSLQKKQGFVIFLCELYERCIKVVKCRVFQDLESIYSVLIFLVNIVKGNETISGETNLESGMKIYRIYRDLSLNIRNEKA